MSDFNKSEKENLEALNADNFRKVKKSDIVKLFKQIGSDAKKAGLKAMEHFGDFKDFSLGAIHKVSDAVNNLVSSHDKNSDDEAQIYFMHCEFLKEELKQEGITQSERQLINDRIEEFVEKAANCKKDANRFNEDMANKVLMLAGGALAMGGIILGVKFGPTLGRNNSNN